MGSRKYKTVSVSFVNVEPGSSLLVTGSMTKTEISVSTVTVEPFQPGFEDKDGNDFATISFD